MARKKKRKNPIVSFIDFLRDERTQFVTGLVLLVFAIIVTIAFVSYFFTWKTDQSFEWQKVLSSSDIAVDNFSGKFGAYVSYTLISNTFGIAAFAIPFLMFVAGLNLMRIKWLRFWRTLRITLFFAILTSIFLSLVFENLDGYLGYGLGGKHGYFMSEWLSTLLGEVGAYLVVIIAFFSTLVLAYDHILEKIKIFFIQYNPLKDDHSPPATFEEAEPGPLNTDESDDLIFETEFKNREEDDSFHKQHERISFEEVAQNTETTVSATKEEPSHESESKSHEPELSVQNSMHVKEETVKKNLPQEDYDPTLELSNYQYPSIDLLENHKSDDSTVTNEELVSNKNKIVETLANYKIQIDKIKATIGPTITLYEIVPAPGVRISKIKNLEDDIALNLSALGIRIIAPIPGRGTIGIEVPNQTPETVSMRSLIASRKFQESKMELAVALGKTISNETHVFDLTKMPHLLVAGATGQGKSVGLNVILTSLLYKKHPAQLKFVLVDPKKVELTLYSKLEKHFLAKLPDEEEAIVTDTQKVIHTLQSLCVEMDNRYNLLKQAHVRNIKEYNTKFISRKLNPQNGHRYLPYIVVVVDEFADLIMTAGKEVEMPLARLAQLARAIGIHLIIATQRPTTNIITGIIKANFPARVAFRVTSMIDSRTILDSPGANQLVGRGDMLFAPGSDMKRLQCGFLDIPELEKITAHIQEQQSFTTAYILPEVEESTGSGETGEVDLSKRDDLFDEAARLVVIHQQGSTSLIQRKFSIGYNRAGRIVDQLEAAGIVGPFEGSKARQVLFPDEYTLEQYLNQLQSN
ncbi:MAG: DNA translocase FtsK [Bacteroidetes bacterium]|jgi:S-DNA-T family DNA segregation ATPase FtsK/SpoIIIE|nr:DNA translocase FtsK [Bacteroidota bacterium]